MRRGGDGEGNQGEVGNGEGNQGEGKRWGGIKKKSG